MFSLVIPLYNESRNIKFLIEEIISNLINYKNYEIILVNDASTDDTSYVINSFNSFYFINFKYELEKNPGNDLLFHVLRQSTIGANSFHGRVRDGIGCLSVAIVTRKLISIKLFSVRYYCNQAD